MNNNSIDFERAFTFMFKEDEWVTKYVIGLLMAILSIFIVPGIILQGYIIEIARRVKNGQEPALPEWDDWGKFFTDGIAYFVASLVYTLPIVLVSCCVFFLFSGAASASSGGSEDALAGMSLLMMCCFGLLVMVYSIFMVIFLYVGVVNYIRKGSIGAFFEFSYIWNEFRANMGRYGMAALAIWGATIVGSIIPIVGTLWAQYAGGHLMGQLAQDGTSLSSSYGEASIHDLN